MTTDDVPERPPGVALSQLLRGSLVTQLIHVAAALGVADLLSAGPKSSRDLAIAVNANPEALYRVLRALASLGIFTETDPGIFSMTPLAEPLRSDVSGSLRGSAILYGASWWWRACGELIHSVRTGQPAFDHVHGQALFSYLDSARDAAAIFNDHQSNMTQQDAAAVVAAYDFTHYATVIDVGGGHGVLGAAILGACQQTSVVVFDQPAVIATAPRHAPEGGVERLRYVAGDFFESVPTGGYAYVLKDIVHDWGDQEATKILGNCRLAMSQAPEIEARLLVVEKVIPPGNGAFPGKLTDITMLLVTNGRERTANEYQTLLAKAGFTLTRVIPTRSPASVIEAVPTRI
jgi:O-methyltransferase domain/Dimerisation domain